MLLQDGGMVTNITVETGKNLDILPHFVPLFLFYGLEVAENLLFLAPVHRGCPLLVAAGEGLLFGLSCCGTQTQTAVRERV